MGCQETNCAYNDETPPHAVEIRPFALGRREVTRGEFARFVAETGYQTVAEKGRGCWADKNLNWRKPGFDQDDRHPVVCITWEDASKYTAWLSEKTGQPYRLPTEAEWEYAGRAGSLTAYFWGDSPDDAGLYAWYSKNSGVQTHPVGRKRPNAFGLQDLAGNVWEWTADCWHDNYQGAPADGTAWEAENCDRRVVRGGSWKYDPQLLRSANRIRIAPDGANLNLGFRLARAL
jgi:formylglycine-generating enzyme required for sulfatase activity